VLTDLVMPDMDGIEVLKKIKQQNPQIDVVVMTSYGTVTNAVEAMKLGASDYITKPFKRDELVVVIEKILQIQRLAGEVDRLRTELGEKYTFGNIIGESEKIKKIFEIISNVSNTEANILIQGETGTGKELVARAVHYNSARKNYPFVKVDCAALTETLLESELFGHERGAFTGAIKDRIGRFRTADHGTIFLDEIGNISLAVQAKLLRVLQDSEFEAVGSDKSVKVDVRIIAATNADLEGNVENCSEETFFIVSMSFAFFSRRYGSAPMISRCLPLISFPFTIRRTERPWKEFPARQYINSCRIPGRGISGNWKTSLNAQ